MHSVDLVGLSCSAEKLLTFSLLVNCDVFICLDNQMQLHDSFEANSRSMHCTYLDVKLTFS
jgi:hypothetical protein